MRAFNEEKKKEQVDKSPSDERSMFESYYLEWGGGRKRDPSYKSIPCFYTPLPPEDDLLLQKLREESRAAFLTRKSAALLENDELQRLLDLLEENVSPPIDDAHRMINFDDYLKVKEKVSPKCKDYFTAITFSKLYNKDPHGRIKIVEFFHYVMRKVWLQQSRIGLSLYDISGLGYLREPDLENYILEMIPTLPQLNGLEKSFYSFYVCTAVRKFFFFLDPLRTGKIKIQDILCCSFLDELLELRNEDFPNERDNSITNWFSAASALHVYGQYLTLDTDQNGMLSKSELGRYGSGTLTTVFLDRVFQECLTYEGEMDYKTYLDFILALENRKTPQALQYLFKILDCEGEGAITMFSLNFFFRAIQEELVRHGQDVVDLQDLCNEVFDMVKPADPCRITLKDLIKCRQGDIIVSIMIDVNGFWTYENREALVQAENINNR